MGSIGDGTSVFGSRNKRETRIILAIICCGYLVRLYNLITAGAIDMDGVDYAEAARYFASGAFGSALRCVRVPFYSFVTGLFSLLMPDVELAGIMASLVFSVLLIFMVYFFCRRHLGERSLDGKQTKNVPPGNENRDSTLL